MHCNGCGVVLILRHHQGGQAGSARSGGAAKDELRALIWDEGEEEAWRRWKSERWGLPLSRLFLANKEKTEAKSLKVAAKKVKVESVSSRPLKQEVEEEEVKVTVKEEKEEESGPGKEVPSSGSKYFTLSNFPSVADSPSTQPLPRGPCLPPSPVVSPSPPLFTPPWIPFLHPQQFGQMPAANWVVCGGCQMWGTVVPFWAAHST